jgi:site-specific DNA-methyltransferase (cytosine-N4-specific)
VTDRRSTFPQRVLAEIEEKGEVKLPPTCHRVISGDSRRMTEIGDEEVHLVVTSPPYPMIEMWDTLFGSLGCHDYDQMHEYLAEIWKECYRVLKDGGLACINIGDATRKVDKKFRLFPNHSRVIEICEELGFVSLPCILWKKPTTKPNSFLGSGFLPTNAYVTLDCEYILLFRKGNLRKFRTKDPIRYASSFTKDERDTWFSQIWDVKGTKQNSRDMERRVGAYPEQIVYRLVRMFSIIGDTVLDPFLGTGTTTKVAAELYRNSIGYEIDKRLLKLIRRNVSIQQDLLSSKSVEFEFIERDDSIG